MMYLSNSTGGHFVDLSSQSSPSPKPKKRKKSHNNSDTTSTDKLLNECFLLRRFYPNKQLYSGSMMDNHILISEPSSLKVMAISYPYPWVKESTPPPVPLHEDRLKTYNLAVDFNSLLTLRISEGFKVDSVDVSSIHDFGKCSCCIVVLMAYRNPIGVAMATECVYRVHDRIMCGWTVFSTAVSKEQQQHFID